MPYIDSASFFMYCTIKIKAEAKLHFYVNNLASAFSANGDYHPDTAFITTICYSD